MLRCWEERGERSETGTRRFSLEDPRTGQRHGFASLEALAAFLIDRFGPPGAECEAKDAASRE
ncbi:MAG: hypothetical protein JW850_18825 [Thermoflexales bacterium]|nr:hypothetical protein [Thermoflexales bacterium]